MPAPTAPGPPARPRLTLLRALRSVAVLAVVALLLVRGLPWVAGVTWAQVWERVASVAAPWLLLLLALKGLALLAYTVFYRASLPGMTTWQALVANVSGTAVSQLAPGGGAIGVGATWVQARSWGLPGPAIASSVLVTGLWNVLARVLLPVLGLAVLLASGGDVPVPVMGAAAGAAGIGLVVLGAAMMLLTSRTASGAVGGPLVRLAGLVSREVRGLPPQDRAALVERQRRDAVAVVRGRWPGLSLGLAGWFAAYFLLFWACLHASGVTLPWPHLFAAYAVGRLLTAVAVTPGGIGITEAGMLAMLTATGADPAAATAGVLLFAVFHQLLEIPLGALAWAAWWFGPRQR